MANAENTFKLATTEQIIDDARNGRMYILVDAEDRENEGDLIIPSQFATPEAINFMATHGRGLICMTIDKARADRLELRNMTIDNRARFETAFTQSIEAREGITTGISVADRAHTIAVATNPEMTKEDIVSPGHVFPIIAKEGGVLVRTGHTEASVDISRLAGLNPSAVICEIMNEDGTMARLPELIEFAKKHNMNIGTIDDLIEHRLKTEHSVSRVASGPFVTQRGYEFTIHIYRNNFDGREHVALTRGEPQEGVPSLVRMHKINFAGDVLNEKSPRAGKIWDAVKQLAEHDGHAMLGLIREGSIDSLLVALGAKKLTPKKVGPSHTEIREYGIGLEMLKDQGVRDMVIIDDHVPSVHGVEAYDVKIVDFTPLKSNQRS